MNRELGVKVQEPCGGKVYKIRNITGTFDNQMTYQTKELKNTQCWEIYLYDLFNKIYLLRE